MPYNETPTEGENQMDAIRLLIIAELTRTLGKAPSEKQIKKAIREMEAL